MLLIGNTNRLLSQGTLEQSKFKSKPNQKSKDRNCTLSTLIHSYMPQDCKVETLRSATHTCSTQVNGATLREGYFPQLEQSLEG